MTTANGAPPALPDALEYEQTIAAEAESIREEATELTPTLFLALSPLLRQPIPDAFIVTTPPVKGKPYPSTGVRSVQVLIDRMDNVLTPLWWHHSDIYEQEGRLCRVTIIVGVHGAPPMFTRSSWGGVNQGSTLGNVYKGSFTNAAKRAIAMVGPGHEVYIGTDDLDPDTSEDAAKAQEPAKTRKPRTISEARAKAIYAGVQVLDLEDKLQLAATHVHGDDVGDCSTEAKAIVALRKLTSAEADKVDKWLEDKRDA